MNIKGHDLKITWGRPRPTGPKTEVQAATTQNVVLPPLESMQIPAPPGEAPPDFLYPSQGKKEIKFLYLYLLADKCFSSYRSNLSRFFNKRMKAFQHQCS